MRVLVLSAIGAAAACHAHAAGPPRPLEQNGWLIYQDSHITETAPCTQQPIMLRGNHTTFNLTGACRFVQVAGEHNDITIQIGPAATIEIVGEHNDVTWQQVAPGPPPTLLDRASSNTFHHAAE